MSIIQLACVRAQELCESRGGRPGLPSLIKKNYGFCGRKATLQPTSLSVLMFSST